MNMRPRVRSKHLGMAAILALFAVGACGPVAGPWGPVGGEWKFVCGAPRKLGEACGTSYDCASDLFCTEANTGFVGVCQPRVAAAAECKNSEDCKEGLVCKSGLTHGICYLLTCDKNNVCTQGAASGSKCDLSGLDCPNPGKQVCSPGAPDPGTCVTAPKIGDDCSPFIGDFSCGKNLVCQRLTVKCAALPKTGELCGIGPIACAPGFVCRTDKDEAKDGRCGVPSKLGQSCLSAGMCEKGTYCDLAKLVCATNKKVGSSCKNGNECGDVPFDVHNGVDCVQGECVDTSVVGGKCWPGYNNHCSAPMTCAPKGG